MFQAARDRKMEIKEACMGWKVQSSPQDIRYVRYIGYISASSEKSGHSPLPGHKPQAT